MKRSVFFVLLCAMFMVGLAGNSNGFDITSVSDHIYIESIDALRIINSPSPELRVAATFANTSERVIRLKNGHFDLYIRPASGEDESSNIYIKDLGGKSIIQPISELHIGTATMGVGSKKSSPFVSDLDYFEILSQGSGQGILRIPLPMSEPERNLLINRLVNYIGLPGSFESIALIGKVSLGFGGKRGWAYQDLSLLELSYIPDKQSKVLFK